MNIKKLLPVTACILFISSCGGGGGGGGDSSPTPTTPTPTVNLSADPVSVLLGSTSTLTWSSNNATSCSASWTSQTGSSGSEAVTISTVGNNSFSITCSGAGGSRSATVTVEGYRNTDGVVVDGYISGAEVCIDEDESWTCDSSESSTTSDNDGKFTIKYANGNLVSIGGTDLDSQTLLDNLLITHKLTGHSDFKAVTPVTSVAAFMTDASLVNAALGIDSSIDVSTFDPVANKGDGGVNDYLYEKGNQLTVLAFALQNITNNLNTTTETTQDYFKAITEEIEKEYTETTTKVDIETEDFITKTLDNIVEAKSVTIDETAKANTSRALASVMPIIEVKSSDDLTTSVIRFAVSTLQTDIQAIANGTASSNTITSYQSDILNYIASDQSIDAGEIAPSIFAVSDSATTQEDTAVTINVLANDSYLSSSPVLLSVGSPNNGSTVLAESAPEQIIYTPASDFNGTDSFTYTITQGAKTSNASVSITVQAVNDNPSLNVASTLSILEGETSVSTISTNDVDGDELTLTISGTDASSFSLSSDNVLSLRQAANYDEKNTYSIILNLTDGINTVTKTITVLVIKKGEYVFSGKTIDGYIQGARVFLDQNFNFRFDTGELSSVTNADGSFEISTNDIDLYNCVKSRPIVADVPIGAIDSTLGEVTKAYRMVLPSISDTGNSAIVISPFTSLLGDAIVQAKSSSSIKDELTLAEGCSDPGNNIASSITSELNQIKSTLSSSLDVSYDDLVIDFIANTSNSIITETSAQNIAKFFPYFKQLTDEFDSELSTIHNKTINTDVSIKKDSINAILADSEITEIPVSFSAIYKTEPNDQGWFIQEKITAFGANLNNSGEMKHYTCFGDSDNCSTSDISLVSLRDASQRYTRTSSFINNNYNPLTYNYQLVVEDEQRVNFDFDGNPNDRVCILQNWLYLTPVNQRENFTTNDRYNTGAASGRKIDKCVAELADKNEALFVALVDSYDDGTYFEEIDIRITNPDYSKSTFFSNKLNDLYNNRDNLNVDPLIQEIASIPRTFKAINILRDKLSTTSTDNIAIYWTKRNSASQITESSIIRIGHNPDNDSFEYATYENSDTGSIRTEVINSSGQQARNDLFSTINSKSKAFNNAEFNGLSAVTDQRTSLTGKTIDGYISGATVFFDVNFNQRLDAGEYSGTTNEDGTFEIKVNDSDLVCIKARPIVANIPVGAEDSTLGTVTKAYQMLLPSVNDAGSNELVISPFTSLIGEAILKGKNDADLTEDLSVYEGCQSEGDAVASKISAQVSSLISNIESNYGITLDDLINDFIASGGSSKITEELAQKVAAFFPSYNKIKEDISSELSTRYGKDVTPNVSLSSDSLDAILKTGEFTSLPLEFFSIYKTKKNLKGFYNIDEISSTGASVNADGSLNRYLCTLTNSANCSISDLSLAGVADASKIYQRQVNINNDNFSVDGVVGNINIRGSESSGIRNEDSTAESYCESQETIQFVGPQDSKGLQMEYRYGFGRGVTNLKTCSLLPNYGPSIGLRIEKQGRGVNFPDTAPTWAIQFSVNNHGTSRLTESKVYNIIDNDNLDPESLIKEVAQIPAALSKIDEMRKLLSYGESAFYYYSPNTSPDRDNGETFKTYNYRVSSVPRDDQYSASECPADGGCNDIGETLYGQDARDAIFNIMSGSDYDYDGFIGESAPVSNILFEYESQGIQFNDRLIDGKNRDYRIYPRFNTSTKWIDASLVGSAISKASIDAFINGSYTTDTKFFLGLNVDAPFTSVEEFNLRIYSNDQYSSSSEYLDLTVELKIETLPSGAVQVTWLDEGKITFKFVDGDVSITKNVINTRGDISKSIPKGDFNVEDFDFFKSLLNKVRNQFGASELQLIKDFFKSGSNYSYKIDLGAYAILDDYDQISSIIAGTFDIDDIPVNSIYSYHLAIIFGEGTKTDICFNTAWSAEDDITFEIKPVYRNKPGFLKPEEVNFSSNTVTIDKGTSQKCVTFSSPIDDKLQEKQEFIEFEIANVVNAKTGRNIPIRLTVQDD
jgi:hypothetical protein